MHTELELKQNGIYYITKMFATYNDKFQRQFRHLQVAETMEINFQNVYLKFQNFLLGM